MQRTIKRRERQRGPEGLHKTELSWAPIASQCFLGVLTSQTQLSRALAIDRACDPGRQAPGSGNQVFSSLPCFKDWHSEGENAGVIFKFKFDCTYTGSPLEMEIVKHWLDATLILPGTFKMQK